MPDKILIEWSRERLRVVVAGEDGNRPQAHVAATREMTAHADPQIPVSEAASAVREWLDRERVGRGPCTVVVPREAVVVRRLQLPQAPDDELPDLVRFQAATKTSAPIETLALDFLSIPGEESAEGLQVVTFTVDRQPLQRLTEVLQEAGLTVQQVTVSSLTVCHLVRRLAVPDLGKRRPDLVVYQSGNRVEMSILDRGTLVFSHALQLPEDAEGDRLRPLKSELSRSMVALSQMHADASVERCCYISGTPEPAVSEFLQKRFESGFRAVDVPATQFGFSLAGYEPLAGALLPETDELLRINFVSPRRRREVPDRRRLYASLAGAGLVLILLIAYGLFSAQRSALDESIAALLEQRSTGQKELDEGKPRLQAYDRVAAWQEKDFDEVELWNRLRQHLPGTQRLYLTELNITPGLGDVQVKYTGKGLARDRADVNDFYQVLSLNGFRPMPPVFVLKTIDPDYPFEFKLDVELLRPQTKQPAKEVAAASAGGPRP